MNVKIIVAMCKNRGIGYQNSIPWRIKEDLLCTKEMPHYITTNNIDSFLWCIARF